MSINKKTKVCRVCGKAVEYHFLNPNVFPDGSFWKNTSFEWQHTRVGIATAKGELICAACEHESRI